MQRGTYIWFKLSEDSTIKLNKYIIDNMIATEPRKGFHVSVMDSVTNITDKYIILANNVSIDLKPESYNLCLWLVDDIKTGISKEILVLTFENSKIRERHEYGLSLGAEHRFETFDPHITLTMDVNDELKNKILQGYIKIPNFELEVICENKRDQSY